MQVTKLANLSQMRADWKRIAKKTFIDALAPIGMSAVIGGLIQHYVCGKADVTLAAKLPAFWNWYLSLPLIGHIAFALPVVLLLSIPMVLMATGPYPAKDAVKQNQAIRRAFGMSDEVEPETADIKKQ